MSRVEFSKKVRAEAFMRCGGNCEKCGARLKHGEAEFDHRIPCALGGEATLENAQVLCRPCHRDPGAKTADDQRTISKAKRNYLKDNGLWPKSRARIQSRGFSKTRKQA